MKKDLTLVVLAAGMGSRFGGLKQIEPVGPNGEFIIDYSVYDAIKAGFNKVVFIIKEENYNVFKETIGKRIENKIAVEYVFQKISDVPEDVHIPKDRVKPLGTAHAIYAARDVVHENFAIINADDFYGTDAYMKAAQFLRNCEDNEYGNVAFQVGNTLTLNGEVKRGIIFASDGEIQEIVESSVKKYGDLCKARPLDGSEEFTIPDNQTVSMNLFCFTPKIFDYLKENISPFFQSHNDSNAEWLIPDIAVKSAAELNKRIKLIETNSKFYGMTYREDLESLKNGILSEIEKGVYKKDLWG